MAGHNLRRGVVALAIDFSRRHLLQGILGLSSLPLGCRLGRDRVEARFVDPSVDKAHHWLRDRAASESGTPLVKRTSVLVLGAGVSGLAAAWQLRKRGIPFSVLELESEPGGTALGCSTPWGGAPWGAHYVPAPDDSNPNLVQFLHELGVMHRVDGKWAFEEDAMVSVPEERVFHRGRWHQGLFPRDGVPPGSSKALATFESRMTEWAGVRGSDGRKAFSLPMAASSQDPRFLALDEISFGAWLNREGLTHPAISWVADYATRDDFGARPEDVSAWYGIHYFAGRRNPNTGRSAPFLTWPSGNAHLVEAMVKRVGRKQLYTGRLVRCVKPHERGWAVQVETEHGSELWFSSKVIWALPDFLCSKVLEIPETAMPEKPAETSSWLVANLHLKRRPRYQGVETAWDNVIFDSASLGYVVSTHQFGPWSGPTTWTWYLPLAPGRLPSGHKTDLSSVQEARTVLYQLEVSDALELVLSDLLRAHPDLKECIERVEFRRWGHAMALPKPGCKRARPAPYKGLHFAHANLSGVGLFEEAVYHGQAAVNELSGLVL